MQQKNTLPFLILYSLTFISLSICPYSYADNLNSQTTYEVARDLFAYRGLFNSNETFQNLYVQSASHFNNDQKRATHLLNQLMDCNIYLKDLRLLRFPQRLANDLQYRNHFHNQLVLAYKHLTSIKPAIEWRNYKKSKVKSFSWKERWTNGETSYGIGFIFALSFSFIPNLIGAPEAYTFITPIITLPTMGILARIMLANTGASKTTRDAIWAENNMKEIIATMGEQISVELGIPKFPRGHTPKRPHKDNSKKANLNPLTEVIKLRDDFDGSPLLITKKDLSDALNFRNSIVVYRGHHDKVQDQDGHLFYPSKEVVASWGNETQLISAFTYNRILIPANFRKSGDIANRNKRQKRLLNSLSQIVNNQIMSLATPINITIPEQPCAGLTAVATDL